MSNGLREKRDIYRPGRGIMLSLSSNESEGVSRKVLWQDGRAKLGEGRERI